MLSLILVEAAVVGSVASILGVAIGVLLGDRLLVLVSQSINDLYFRLNVTDVMVSPFSVAKGLAAGVGASLAAAAVPAIEAMSFPEACNGALVARETHRPFAAARCRGGPAYDACRDGGAGSVRS